MPATRASVAGFASLCAGFAKRVMYSRPMVAPNNATTATITSAAIQRDRARRDGGPARNLGSVWISLSEWKLSRTALGVGVSTGSGRSRISTRAGLGWARGSTRGQRAIVSRQRRGLRVLEPALGVRHTGLVEIDGYGAREGVRPRVLRRAEVRGLGSSPTAACWRGRRHARTRGASCTRTSGGWVDHTGGGCNPSERARHMGRTPRRPVLSEERLELGDRSERTRGLVATGQKVAGTDLPLRDALLQITQRRVDKLATRGGTHHPALGSAQAGSRRMDLELVATVRALDRGPALGDQSVVELVLGPTAAAADVHPGVTRRKRRRKSSMLRAPGYAFPGARAKGAGPRSGRALRATPRREPHFTHARRSGPLDRPSRVGCRGHVACYAEASEARGAGRNQDHWRRKR